MAITAADWEVREKVCAVADRGLRNDMQAGSGYIYRKHQGRVKETAWLMRL